ncbi:ExeM/NucH family extracellular endonuclease [Nocardioides renjunii]|uniref:ExeM/NucH family extracellular endonuclease n=1 Tax=Nocardioides renjunii TaxID=3095075 RepID=UPI002AFF035D|nr:ExeM/NucH family extracellular endonuclease [Nocardioides sp. S-34]WQQ24049.1 ExeM/NucH family extracellular endonuclease [Nocardioides sp. S-34]
MRTPALPSPRHIAAGAGLALLAAGFTPLAASANPAGTGLVINEVYGGGGNTGAVFTNDFIELHNPSTSAISVNGLSLQYRSAAGTGAPGASNVFSLPNKTIQPGGYFLVQAAPGATVTDKPLPVTPDAQTTGTTLNLSGTGGQVYLVNGTAPLDAGTGTISNASVVDFVGWGTTTTSYEGEVVAPATRNSAPATTNATSISRKTAGTVVQDTDSNAADFATAATPSPTTTSVAGPLTVAQPGNKSGQADVPIAPFTLTATGGTSPYTWSATGLPAGVTVAPNGAVSGTPTAPGIYTVTATATDSATPTAATDDVTFTFTVTAAPTLIPISAVQGTGAVSPLVGQKVITRGIVTATYPSGGFRGFYIQTPGSGAANIDLAAHTASDGVFVRQPSGSIDGFPGDYVEVTGNVTEFAGATQIEAAAADITPLVGQNPAPVVTTTTATWPRAAAQKESLEGMRYRPTGDFTVTNTFSTNNFGEVGLAQGTKPLIQRTEVELPGPAASSATEADNLARGVVLDDGSSTNFLLTGNATDCAPRPTGCLLNGDQTPPYVSTKDPVRVGARATFVADVIFTEGGSPSAPTYRFQPLTTVVGPTNAGSPATFENTRTAAPDEALINEVGTADLKIASFNVLNYFTTLGDANDDNIGDGGCTPFRDRDDDGNTVNGGCDQRGAWDPQDFQRQQSKIVSAINALDADVVGLMEIENSKQLGETPDEATNSLVAALNAEAGAGTWAANPSSSELPADGMDVITNAIIYKPASVDRIGESRALGTLSDAGEAFDNAREPVGQVFRSDAGGDPFLFVVNHFKSKGSAGPNPGDTDAGDGQGASNGSRKLQATALRDWVTGVQAETGVQSVVMGGDYNSYAMEDPLRILYDAGFTNVEQHFDNGEFSYSFSGLSGSLDHILVNDAALKRSTGTDIWNINGGESLALEYSRWNYHATDFHAAGPYRSSDHDPVILGFRKTAPTAPPVVADTSVTGSAGTVVYGKAGTVTVKVAPATATGTVTVAKGASVLGSATLASGQGSVTLAAKSLPVGTHTLALAYSGDAGHKPSTGSVTVVVSKADPTLGAKVTPKKVKVGKKATIKITVSAQGFTPTGKVSVKVGGKTYRATLKKGRAVITLKAFKKPGTYKAKVSYSGDATTEEARTRVTVKVKRR